VITVLKAHARGTADGEFIDGVLHHGGMLSYKEEKIERHR